MFRNKTFLRIFSLVVAVSLWTYVMLEIDPQKKVKIKDIPVSFANEEILAEDGLAPTGADGVKVTAKIKGRRSLLNEAAETGLTASVDVSSCRKGKNSGSIQINVPDGLHVEKISMETLDFSVEDLKEAQKPVHFEFEGTPAQTDKVPWVIGTDMDTVTVSGAETLVDSVKSVKGIITADEIPQDYDIKAYADPSAVDKDGAEVPHITIKDSESLYAYVRMLSVRDVELDIDPEGIPDGYAIDEMNVSDTVTLAGPRDVLESLEKIEGTVDLQDVQGTETTEAEVDLHVPEGVYLYDMEDPFSIKIRLKES